MVAPIVAALIPEIIDLFKGPIESMFPDSAAREQQRLEYQLKLQNVLNQIDLAQIEVNKQEAAHASIFVAGGRPFIMWVCGVAFAYHYVLQPLMAFFFAAFGHPVPLPAFDMDAMMYVLGGLLGLGTMRSWEKGKGLTGGLSGSLPWRSQS